jgi:hypothetical protein
MHSELGREKILSKGAVTDAGETILCSLSFLLLNPGFPLTHNWLFFGPFALTNRHDAPSSSRNPSTSMRDSRTRTTG